MNEYECPRASVSVVLVACVSAKTGADGGFTVNITVGSLYDKSTVDTYDKMMAGK